MAKDTFIMYKGQWAPIEHMTNEQLGRLFRAIYNYQIEESTVVDEDIKVAFLFFVNQFKIDNSKYERKVENIRRNATGKRVPKNKSERIETNRNETEQIGSVYVKDVYDNNVNAKDVNVNNVCVYNDTQRAPAREEQEITHTQVLYILFFRNIKNAEEEADRFLGYYQSTNWCLPGGEELTTSQQKCNRAQTWKPMTIEPRFNKKLLSVWKKLCEKMDPQLLELALSDRTSLTFDSYGKAEIKCAAAVAKYLNSEGQREATGEILGTLPKGAKITKF